MTVQTTSSKAGPFFGNGVTLIWNSGFRVDQPADLLVLYTDPTGAEILLDPSLYTATGFADPAGVSITYPLSGAPIGGTEKITLLRLVSYDQQTNITNQGGFYPAVLERALDRIVYQTQQLAEKLGRAAILSASSVLNGPLLPDPQAGQFLRGRVDGTGYENADVTGSGAIGVPVLVLQGGTGATTAPDARGNLGLGSAAVLDAGTAAGNAVQLDGAAKLPPVDGSQLTGIWSGVKNRIINGGMDIAQRGTSFSVTASTSYTLDRWAVSASGAGVLGIAQQADAPASNEFQNSLRATVTTADNAITAADQAHIRQAIEGYNVRDLIGRDLSIAFWVRSAKIGIHCLSLRNSGSDRSYLAEYAVIAANTWERKSVTVPGGLITAGTWNWTNGIGLLLSFALVAGTTFQAAAGTWQAGNFLATANQVNCLDTIGNIFALTGVQLEVGSVATPFEHRLFSAELALCQRYYEKTFPLATAPAQNGGTAGALSIPTCGPASQSNGGTYVAFKVNKRAIASVVLYNPAAVNAQVRNATRNTDCTSSSVTGAGETGFTVTFGNPSTAGAGDFNLVNWSADVEL